MEALAHATAARAALSGAVAGNRSSGADASGTDELHIPAQGQKPLCEALTGNLMPRIMYSNH